MEYTNKLVHGNTLITIKNRHGLKITMFFENGGYYNVSPDKGKHCYEIDILKISNFLERFEHATSYKFQFSEQDRL